MDASTQVQQGIIASVIEGESEAVAEKVRAALEDGVNADFILNDCLTPAMVNMGEMLDRGEVFIPDVLWAAAAMQQGLQLLLPHLSGDSSQSAGAIVIGTVQGDVHDIGKNFVGIMLSGAGFEVHDLGHDVPAEAFVQAVAESGARLLGMSAMLTTTMPVMARTIKLLEERGMRDDVRVLVGGAPVTEAYSDKIGADGWAIDATKAVMVAREVS